MRAISWPNTKKSSPASAIRSASSSHHAKFPVPQIKSGRLFDSVTAGWYPNILCSHFPILDFIENKKGHFTFEMAIHPLTYSFYQTHRNSFLPLYRLSNLMQKAYPADLRHMTPIQLILVPIYKCDLIRTISVKRHVPAYSHRLKVALPEHPLHVAIAWINKNIICTVISGWQ